MILCLICTFANCITIKQNKMIKKLIFLSAIILFANTSNAQGYKISVQVKNLSDSSIYLGYHYGDGFFVIDTVQLDTEGKAVFSKNKALKGGIYFILFPKGKYFDFLIDKDQNFEITTDTVNFLHTVRFKDSYQNDLFFRYQNYLNNVYRQIALLREKQKTLLGSMDSLMAVEQQIEIYQNKVYLEKEKLANQHPDSLISVLIKAGLPIIPPPAPRDTSGAPIDSLFEYKYVKAHFFDNFNFADERLIRTSLLNNKVLEYLTRMVPQYPDTIIKELDWVLDKAKANDEVYKFILNTLFSYYSRSSIISDENVFVHIAENYMITDKAPWVSEDFKTKLKEDIALRKPNLVGKKAPDFSMQDINNKTVNLRDVQNNYVVLYFYNPDCEICKEVTPELMNFYRIIKDRGVSIIAINTGEDKDVWKTYVNDNYMKVINLWDPKNKSGYRELYNIKGTPLIFLLDEDQKIITKRVTVEQLMGFFNTL